MTGMIENLQPKLLKYTVIAERYTVVQEFIKHGSERAYQLVRNA